MITVKARDFSDRTTDTLRDRWTGATMAALVEALNGTEVLIETDNMTGHTLRGTLVSVQAVWHGSPKVLIKGDGLPAGGVNYDLFNCGNVVILETFGTAKWNALGLYRKQRSAAIERVAAEHGEGRNWGEWTARPMSGPRMFAVSYEPSTGNPAAAERAGGSGTKLYGVAVTV